VAQIRICEERIILWRIGCCEEAEGGAHFVEVGLYPLNFT